MYVYTDNWYEYENKMGKDNYIILMGDGDGGGPVMLVFLGVW